MVLYKLGEYDIEISLRKYPLEASRKDAIKQIRRAVNYYIKDIIEKGGNETIASLSELDISTVRITKFYKR